MSAAVLEAALSRMMRMGVPAGMAKALSTSVTQATGPLRSVLGFTASLPANPNAGDSYVLTTGDYEDQIAVFSTDGTWQYSQPWIGDVVYDIATGTWYFFFATGWATNAYFPNVFVNLRSPKYGLTGVATAGDGAKILLARDDAIATSRILYGPGGTYLLDSGRIIPNPDGTLQAVVIASTGDNSGITFTVNGTIDKDGTVETWTGAGPVASGSITTADTFLTITSITHTGTVTGAVTIGTSSLANAISNAQSPGSGAILLNGEYVLGAVAYLANYGAALPFGGFDDDTSGISIIGDGPDRTVFMFPEADPILSRNGAFRALNYSNSVLANFGIDCTGSLDGNGIAILSDETDGVADNWTVENVRITKSFNSGFVLSNGPTNGRVTNVVVDHTTLESHDVEGHAFLISSFSDGGIVYRRPTKWTFTNCQAINPSGGGCVVQGGQSIKFIGCDFGYEPEYEGDRSPSGYPGLRLGNGSIDIQVIGCSTKGMARSIRSADTSGLIVTNHKANEPEFEAILDLKQNGEANKTTPHDQNIVNGISITDAHNSTLVESFAWLRADTDETSIYTNFMTMNEAGENVACNPGNPPSGNPMVLGQYLEGGGYPRNGGQRVGVVSYAAPYSLQVVDAATDITSSFSVPTSVSSGVPFTSGFVDVSADSCGASVTFTKQGSDPEVGVNETVGTITVERYTATGGGGTKLADLTVNITNTKTNINTGVGVTVSAVARSVGVQDGTAFQSLRLIVNNTTTGGQAQNFDASILVYTLGATVNSSIDREQVKVLTAIGLNSGDAIYFQSGDNVGCSNVTNVCTNGRVTNVVKGETLNQDSPLRNFFCDYGSIVSSGHSGLLVRTLDGYTANTLLKLIQASPGGSIVRLFDNSPTGYPYLQGTEPDTFAVSSITTGGSNYVANDVINMSDQSQVKATTVVAGAVTVATANLGRSPTFNAAASTTGVASSATVTSGVALDLSGGAWFVNNFGSANDYADLCFGMPSTVTFGQPAVIYNTAGVDLSAVTFAISGRKWNTTTTITENMLGPAAGAGVASSPSVNAYSRIYSITPNATPGTAVSVGATGIVTEVGQMLDLTDHAGAPEGSGLELRYTRTPKTEDFGLMGRNGGRVFLGTSVAGVVQKHVQIGSGSTTAAPIVGVVEIDGAIEGGEAAIFPNAGTAIDLAIRARGTGVLKLKTGAGTTLLNISNAAANLNGVTVGNSTPAPGSFTTLNATSGINATNIGAATPGTGRFTTLQATGATSVVDITATGYMIRSVAGSLTATGSAYGDALQLSKQVNRVTNTVAGTGVILPVGVQGMTIYVFNDGANTLTVYGNTTTPDTINGSVSKTIAATGAAAFFFTAAGVWRAYAMGALL